MIGLEAEARIAYKYLLEHGVILNCIEFPAVRRGEARFRMQLTPDHTKEQLAAIPPKILASLHHARRELGRRLVATNE